MTTEILLFRLFRSVTESYSLGSVPRVCLVLPCPIKQYPLPPGPLLHEHEKHYSHNRNCQTNDTDDYNHGHQKIISLISSPTSSLSEYRQHIVLKSLDNFVVMYRGYNDDLLNQLEAYLRDQISKSVEDDFLNSG